MYGRRTVCSKVVEYVRHYHRLRQHNKHSAVPGVPGASRAPWAATCFGRASASGQQADAGIERPLFLRRAFSRLQCSCLKREVIGLAGVGAGAPSASAVAVLAVAGSPRHRSVEAEVVEEPEPRSGDRRMWSWLGAGAVLLAAVFSRCCFRCASSRSSWARRWPRLSSEISVSPVHASSSSANSMRGGPEQRARSASSAAAGADLAAGRRVTRLRTHPDGGLRDRQVVLVRCSVQATRTAPSISSARG